MSWRPHEGRELAAACCGGVLVWTIELGTASYSLSHATFLRQRNHAPVTGVAWHPEGDLLVSCSPNDLNIVVWDVARETGVPLRRLRGGGQCILRWSSCGAKLLAATCRTSLGPWTAERWTVPNGRVAVACFGPYQTLLFTSTEDPATLFSLPMQDNIFDARGVTSFSDTKVAIPLIDLTKIAFCSRSDEDDDSANGEEIVGGRVVAMDWDPSGKYLAILFQDSPLVAVFKTSVGTISRVTQITPGYLIKGFSEEYPNCLQFHQFLEDNSKQKACLTISWTSSCVQQFPIVEISNSPVKCY
ncbi:hypothetical protein KQX54_014698 [Cotesia glomerata]|uniref:Aladin seven-bladed propeller domain-containing protein n=1 Tax=Cotesia glomerata TaxID=32391 RepID=A0AAV7IVL5_COTGL|nr:hypothetical protein KQX54_014698 [Cotesia glomerata]